MDVICLPMRVPEPFIRWRPALLALVLGLSALLRGLPGLVPTTAQADPLIAAAHVLCLSQDGADGEGPSVPRHESCDLCCLPGARSIAALPASAGPWLPPVVWHITSTAVPVREARAPPFEAWAPDRGQRGPPLV